MLVKMAKTIFEALFIAAFVSCLSVALAACADGPSCDLKTYCLNKAISCLTGKSLVNQSQVNGDKLQELENEIAQIKAQLASAGQPGGFAKLDQNGRLSQSLLPAGYDQYSAFDLAWQSLHVAAAAACRGSTASGGKGCCENKVMVRNTADLKTCALICSQSSYPNCDGEVSLYGREGKANKNGEMVGSFYNYECNSSQNGGSEASSADEGVKSAFIYFSFCCCRA
ncbi:uncharacterized protein LOC144655704 isoform X2 [Oculina patagonica]